MTRFVTADLHKGHEGVTRFTKRDGSKLRPWDSAAEMDEALIDLWNSVVKPQDRVYVLGDVAMSKRHIDVTMLNGRKVLIPGNHDIFKAKQYLEAGFEDIRGYKVVDGGADGPRAILSHIPIHPDEIRRFKLNIHGHLHANVVEEDNPAPEYGGPRRPDLRYVCVSVEHTNFKPIDLDQLIDERMAKLKLLSE